MKGFYLTFDGEPVSVQTTSFVTPTSSSWMQGIFDVTIFPTRKLAMQKQIELGKFRTTEWKDRLEIVKLYAAAGETKGGGE